MPLTRTFHTRVAADVSWRRLRCGKSAPTDVGGYILSVNPAECEISKLRPTGSRRPVPAQHCFACIRTLAFRHAGIWGVGNLGLGQDGPILISGTPMQRIHRAIVLPIAICLLAGCSTPQADHNASVGTSKVFKGQPPPWRFFVTITPEEIDTARFAPDCRPADNDSDGHWGTRWEGVQLSIRLPKRVFTNGEPIVAYVTLRNVGDTVRYFWVSTPQPERDTKIFLLKGQEPLPPANGPKPGQSFQQRLKYVWNGSSHQEPLIPGTQRQFLRSLSDMFELEASGSYSAHAEREVVALKPVAGRPGYLRGSITNLLSGTVTFQVIGSGPSK